MRPRAFPTRPLARGGVLQPGEAYWSSSPGFPAKAAKRIPAPVRDGDGPDGTQGGSTGDSSSTGGSDGSGGPGEPGGGDGGTGRWRR